jgi:hypothetical protein
MFEYLKLRDNYAEKIRHDKAIWKHFFLYKKKEAIFQTGFIMISFSLPSTKLPRSFSPIFRKHSLSSSVIIPWSASRGLGTHAEFNFDKSLAGFSILLLSCKIHEDYFPNQHCSDPEKIMN